MTDRKIQQTVVVDTGNLYNRGLIMGYDNVNDVDVRSIKRYSTKLSVVPTVVCFY